MNKAFSLVELSNRASGRLKAEQAGTQGFSLVELSIVLVILGLLTGGILAGQNLIRAAELRSVSTEYARWITATQTFRDKYFALPGDFKDATKFWNEAGTGSYSGACPGTNATPSTGPETCDGDGDGEVDGNNEQYRYWQQLANAGLIEGTYTGVMGSGGTSHSIISENVPRSKLGNAGWTMWHLGDFTGSGNAYNQQYGNTFEFGAQTATGRTIGGTLTSEELWNTDTKIDDGLPAQGKVIAYNWNNCTTSVSNTDYAGEYDFSYKPKSCSMYIARSF